MDGPEHDEWLVSFFADVDSILRADICYAVSLDLSQLVHLRNQD
jgi:hypothetical protein